MGYLKKTREKEPKIKFLDLGHFKKCISYAAYAITWKLTSTCFLEHFIIPPVLSLSGPYTFKVNLGWIPRIFQFWSLAILGSKSQKSSLGWILGFTCESQISEVTLNMISWIFQTSSKLEMAEKHEIHSKGEFWIFPIQRKNSNACPYCDFHAFHRKIKNLKSKISRNSP